MSHSPTSAPPVSPLQRPADSSPARDSPSFSGWRTPFHTLPPHLSLNGSNNGSRASMGPRRTSVQFAAESGGLRERKGSPKPRTSVGLRRLSSPPPPTRFKPRGVSFDTFANPDANINTRIKGGIDQSLTLRDEHRDYKYTARSRTFLCGYDTKPYSENALEWLIDELADDGDEIVCLRVIERDDKLASGASIEEQRYRDVADETLAAIRAKNTESKGLRLIMVLTVGKVEEQIEHMIRLYEPSILVVGTKGRPLTGVQALIQPGSVSKYCIQNSPVPVIVVRPSQSRLQKREKRLNDPSRQGYRDVLARSIGRDAAVLGNSPLDPLARSLIVPEVGEATEEEARAVAAAIGQALPPIHIRSGSFAHAQSDRPRKSKIDIDALTRASAAAQQRSLDRERSRERAEDDADGAPVTPTLSGRRQGSLGAVDEDGDGDGDEDVRVMKSPQLKASSGPEMSDSSEEEEVEDAGEASGGEESPKSPKSMLEMADAR